MLFSALGATSANFTLLNEGFYISLNALGKFVKVIVESVGMIGVGVIVFALILKAITTPFDIYQRIKMRKQSLIMKKLRPDLEKLQKQYANDKQTYSMKMYELQKKNGYSMLGACLPMIISLVVIIIAITAFQSYASFANLEMYSEMAHGYNEAVLVYAAQGEPFRLAGEGEELGGNVISYETFGTETGSDTVTRLDEEKHIRYTLRRDGELYHMDVESLEEDKFISYTYTVDVSEKVRSDYAYRIDMDKLKTNALWETIQSTVTEEMSDEAKALEYLRRLGSAAAASVFRNERDPGFLWVQNVWYPDVSYNHPIQSYDKFKSSFSMVMTVKGYEDHIEHVISSDDYDYRLTADLAEEKEEPNGYFILIVLSIGLMLLSQFITMRSQKDADKFQTVDGQGAMTQKMMMIMMPIMFAVFGFLWSAAFTIYNIISSFLSIVFTLATNLVLDRMFRKREEAEIKERFTRTAPRKPQEPQARRKKGK